jgi:glycine dehydrogenase subunit 1
MPFIPHTEEETQQMLSSIGVDSLQELFNEIPSELLDPSLSQVPEGMNECEVQRLMQSRARQDQYTQCYIGAGSYEHHIPAAVWDVVSRGEYMTAYTPYQAEASQGNLQLLYEYQTMMASLMGMEVANASLYDGASALAEAVLMAIRCNRQVKHKRILVPTSLHPFYRATLASIVTQQGIELIDLPYTTSTGTVDVNAIAAYAPGEISAVIIPQPNFFGALEDVDALTIQAHKINALAIACVNPIAMALLKEPGAWGENGVDIVCGEGQPLGVPMASGGPYFGFMCCRKTYVRQMPGRIVGRTADHQGRIGYALTLQAREQHIRRAKATSNICTNQGLLIAAATIYMSLMGPQGLAQIAATCHTQTRLLRDKLQSHNISQVFPTAFFHEMVLRLPVPVEQVLNKMAQQGIQAGFNLTAHYPELGNALLVCVTETKTNQDIDIFIQQLIETCTSLQRTAKEKVDQAC